MYETTKERALPVRCSVVGESHRVAASHHPLITPESAQDSQPSSSPPSQRQSRGRGVDDKVVLVTRGASEVPPLQRLQLPIEVARKRRRWQWLLGWRRPALRLIPPPRARNPQTLRATKSVDSQH